MSSEQPRRVHQDVRHPDDIEKGLRCPKWVKKQLALNPSYCSWGIFEDYMWDGSSEPMLSATATGWGASLQFDTWKEFGPWALDELNVCANFYFFADRTGHRCVACGGSGQNPETRQIEEDFYDFSNTGRRWCDKITQDEVQALVDRGRLRVYDPGKRAWAAPDPVPAAAEINALNSRHGAPGRFTSHDAINRWILIEARAKRLGVYGHCPACKRRGTIFTEPKAHLGLMLWWLHPRKGASRGIRIDRVERSELPQVHAFLREAAKQNTERFSAILETAGAS